MSSILRNIHRTELLRQGWLSIGSKKVSPNVLYYCSWFRQTTNWILTEILQHKSSRRTVSVISKFIDIAVMSAQLGNFTAVMEILSALHSPIISQQTWENSISKEQKEQLAKLTELLSRTNNFAKYKAALNSKKMCIPFLPVFLLELVLIEDTEPDKIEGCLLNLKKVEQLAKNINTFLDWQQKSLYELTLPECATVRDYILHAYILRESEINKSLNKNFEKGLSIYRPVQTEVSDLANLMLKKDLLNTDKDELSNRDWVKIINASTLCYYKQGDYLIEEGTYNQNLYRIRAGEVTILKNIKGSAVALGTCKTGELLGEMSFLDQYGLASASVVANGYVDAYVITMEEFYALLLADSKLAIKFYKSMAQKLALRLRNLPPPKQSNNPASPQQQEPKNDFCKKLLRKFDLPEEEDLLTEFSCMKNRKRGKLYVFKRFLCFYSTFFNSKSKEVIPLFIVKAIELKKGHLVVYVGNQNHYFKGLGKQSDECFSFINKVWINFQSKKTDKISSGMTLLHRKQSFGYQSQSDYSLTKKDWEILRKGAKCKNYGANEVIIEEGESYQKIFFINKGSCEVTKITKDNGECITVGMMLEGATFGEISFLDGGCASAGVVASKDGAEVMYLDGSFIRVLINSQEDIGGKFYKFLATVVARRLSKREGESFNSMDHESNEVTAAKILDSRKTYDKEKRGTLMYKGRERLCCINEGFLVVLRDWTNYMPGAISSALENLEQITQRSNRQVEKSRRSTFSDEQDSPRLNINKSLAAMSLEMETLALEDDSDLETTSDNSDSSSSKHDSRRRKRAKSMNARQMVSQSMSLDDNEGDSDIKAVIFLDGCTIKIDQTSLRLKLVASDGTYSFQAKTMEQVEDWVGAIYQWSDAHINYYYSSAFPIRSNIHAKWFVDGEETFGAIADAIDAAEQSIFLTDWFLVPEIYMRRKPPVSVDDRLDRLLLKKANQGVQIFILLWNEPSIAVKLNSAATQKKLEAMHPNIHVLRHPPLNTLQLTWSHHQKTTVVDEKKAFVGGLDLCYGRWDTSDHVIVDDCHLNSTWPGHDYHNPTIRGITNPEQAFREHIDRTTTPRMGFHDLHMCVDGKAALDVAKNFMHRWNHHKSINGEQHIPYLYPNPNSEFADKAKTANTTCQIVRSIGEWSGGNRTEDSIYRAYLKMIGEAKHYIYIENQFFISSLAGGGVGNKVALHLLKRIKKAIKAKQTFRTIIVLPVTPDGIIEESAAHRYIMRWQYCTVCRGGKSIIEQTQKYIHKLQQENLSDTFYREVRVEDYISFFALRSHGTLGGHAVTSQIYVHSKLMIVDDCKSIIGSANINDRSMNGDRDSEICVIVDSHLDEEGVMNGEKVKVGRFSQSLRLRLWSEHLGLSPNHPSIIDPIADSVYHGIFRETARVNTNTFNQVFPHIPQDSISKLNLYEKRAEYARNMELFQANSFLSAIKGHLIFFSLDFLKLENLKLTATQNVAVKASVDKSIFQ